MKDSTGALLPGVKVHILGPPSVTDWEDIKKLVNIHRVAATEKEATRMAVMAIPSSRQCRR